MNKAENKRIGRLRRHSRIRAKITGTKERPRFAVYKSNRYLHAQLIDDESRTTLVAGSTKGIKKGARNSSAKGTKTDAAAWLGKEIAKRAGEKGISKVVFDRDGFRYTGRIAEVANAARQGGLQF